MQTATIMSPARRFAAVRLCESQSNVSASSSHACACSRVDLVVEQELAGVQHGPEDVVQALLAGLLGLATSAISFVHLLGGRLARQAADVQRLDRPAAASCSASSSCLHQPALLRSCRATVSPLSRCSACDSVGSILTSHEQTVSRVGAAEGRQEVGARCCRRRSARPGRRAAGRWNLSFVSVTWLMQSSSISARMRRTWPWAKLRSSLVVASRSRCVDR